jgi:hypothetical protein
MNPVKSNQNKENCSPISSNCVIWQGPNLPCLNLCKGDTVSDVVYKLAVEVCELKDSIGLSDIDLTCIVKVCQTTAEPSKTLTNILTLLINKVCCLSDIVAGIPDVGTPYVEPTISLTPYCTELTGGILTSLIHSDLTKRIATVLCDAWSQIKTHSSQIAQLQSDVSTLQSATTPTLAIASCLLGSIQDIDVVLQNLETQFCSYKNVLGTTAQLTSSISTNVVCVNGSTKQLVNPKQTMSAITGWVNTPTTVAQQLQNLWLTVCDMRSAVNLILNTCCQVSCENVIIKIAYKWIDKNTLRLFFTGTSLPMGFYDCGGETVLTLTDGLGNTHDTVGLKLRDADPTILDGVLDDVTISPLYSFDIIDIGSTTPLVVSSGITISGNACFTNDDVTCIKCLNVPVAAFYGDCCTVSNTSTTESLTIIYSI